jgi:predicted MPP superfamily phosphohydrolase
VTTRRKFLQLGVAGAAIGGLAIAGGGMGREANRPKLVSLEIPLARLSQAWDGFRIAQLSDLHYDPYFSATPIRKAIDMVNALQPDLIVLTGDFVTSPVGKVSRRRAVAAAQPIEPCAELLTQLRAPSGVLAILGNHDLNTSEMHVTAVLRSHSIQVLRNACVSLERDGKRLWVAGVDDILEGKPDLELALRGIPSTEPVVLLAHEPDWADYVSHHPVDLQLSGHSHGGQVRLPLVGPLYLPALARKYPWGLRRVGPLTLYTNVGIGTIRVPMRLNCPPEVTLITLRVATGGVSKPG